MMTYRMYPTVAVLAGHLPAGHALAAPAAYHAGCAALLEGQEDRGFAWFAAFKRAVRGREASLPIGPESHFNIAYRQGTLIEDGAYIEALAGVELPGVPAPDFEVEAAPAGGMVLAAAADRHYFRLFAEGFVRGAARWMPDATLHLHVVDPDEATREIFARLRREYGGRALNLSTEPRGNWHSGAYYASSRFLIGPALLARYGGRLALLDLDVEMLAPLDDLVDATPSCALAVFRHDGPGPCSRYPAVLTLWTPRGLELLSQVARFVRSKLDVPWPFNWMLDQAALASAIRWARQYRPDMEIGILNDRVGRHFQPWLSPISNQAKETLIREAGQGAAGLTQ
jgi:hypothetical protein